ncbi:MAG: hypothetical protein KC547_07475 [Anaerolineae bacterium]|nr:hypothetical protein [Anaerolineae bacterium]MCA9911076.1 hypothetical protein [Anaerolineae bacterium]
MPIFIENTTVQATVIDEDMPLTEAQIEKLIRLIMARLATEERNSKSRQDAMRLRNQSLPDDHEQ